MPTDAVYVSIAMITVVTLRNHNATENGNVDHSFFKAFFYIQNLEKRHRLMDLSV